MLYKGKHSILAAILGTVLICPVTANAANVEELERRIEKLERALEQAQQERESIAKDVEMAPAAGPKEDDVNVSLYGRLWPRLTWSVADTTSTDITDALSRVGIAADAKVTDGLTAVLKGEWDVDVEADGDFGDARQAYVGLDSDHWGSVRIGKQWDPHFNIVGEVTDIYYHRNSPFGYDYDEGPFRTNNLLRYAYNFGGLKVDIGVQVNGSLEGGRSDTVSQNADFTVGENSDGDTVASPPDTGTEPNNIDAGSIGVGYNFGSAYLGASFLSQHRGEFERNFYGLGGSWKPHDDLYLAFTYQYITAEVDDGKDYRYTLDALASYNLGNDYTLIGGVFGYDNGAETDSEVLGQNITLIKALNANSRIFAEWVRFDDESTDDDLNEISLGFRYDFNVLLF
jgi:predicted porin